MLEVKAVEADDEVTAMAAETGDDVPMDPTRNRHWPGHHSMGIKLG